MKPLPAAYAWLNKLTVPRTIGKALELYGVTEKAGGANNPEILAWAKETGLAGVYNADSIPWCGLFAAVVCKRADKPVVKDPLWARNWAKFGKVSERPGLGDVLVFARDGGGHVGFYVAEDPGAYHVLGGNQGDAVSIVRIAKSRCIAARRPPYTNQPESVKPYHVAAGGQLSQNEA